MADSTDTVLALQKAIVVLHRQIRGLERRRLAMIAGLAIFFAAMGTIVVSDDSAGYQSGMVAATLTPLAVSAVIQRAEARRLAEAALLQRQFDRLPDRSSGLDPARHTELLEPSLRVGQLAGRWETTPDEDQRLAAWYPIVEGLDDATRLLMRVWVSCEWDVAQRRRAAGWTAACGVVWALIGAAAWEVAGWGWWGFLPGWIAPSAAVFEWATATWFRHRDLADDKRELQEQIVAAIRSTDHRDELAASVDARLLELRMDAPRVPEFIQNADHSTRAATIDGDARRLVA